MINFKIPKTIKIGGQRFKVLYPYEFKERTDIRGQCDYDTLEIRLSGVDQGGNERPISTVWPVFFEEILHALDIQNGHRIFDEKEGHKGLNGLSEGIYQVISDNFQIAEKEN